MESLSKTTTCNNSETARDRTKVITVLRTNKKSYTRFRLVPKSVTTLDDLERRIQGLLLSQPHRTNYRAYTLHGAIIAATGRSDRRNNRHDDLRDSRLVTIAPTVAATFVPCIGLRPIPCHVTLLTVSQINKKNIMPRSSDVAEQPGDGIGLFSRKCSRSSSTNIQSVDVPSCQESCRRQRELSLGRPPYDTVCRQLHA